MGLFAVMLVCGIIAALIAGSKNRSRIGWFLLGCIFGLIAVAVLACLRTLPPKSQAPSPAPFPIDEDDEGDAPSGFCSPAATRRQAEERAAMRADRDRCAREEWEKGRRECPHCAELIRRKATVCRFCGAQVTPEEYPCPQAIDAPVQP
ncbi:Na+/melibiose symporter-like transporter [Desulfobaculum xiamenense]|uniref:Na+/melibiose symporter-like transporter n=1 Tax=Desulfobaculum xiamenense TaxID=995050 RepID=A0A846QLX2_9BACT|nr:hypothetical protein [Desulfobaculum xiamenense]NJB66435.1 Na+/melibiose symporter-like transporter [Desulfobaculum xiamenense]